MKNIIIFFSSVVITLILFLLINIFFKEKKTEEYNINTRICIECNEENIINKFDLNYSDYADEDGNIKLKLIVNKYDERTERFEVALMNNYNQISFSIGDKYEKVLTHIFSINDFENEKTINILIPKENLVYTNNLVLSIRQDIDTYCGENELARELGTVCLNFEFIKQDGLQTEINCNNLEAYDVKEIERTGIFLECLNREDTALIQVKPGEEIKMNMTIGVNENCENIIMWGCFNSEQIEINNKLISSINLEKGTEGKCNIFFSAPKEKGIYEFELFCQPYDFTGTNKYYIISSERYTIKVE